MRIIVHNEKRRPPLASRRHPFPSPRTATRVQEYGCELHLSNLPELDWRKARQTGILEGVLSRSAMDVVIYFGRMVDG